MCKKLVWFPVLLILLVACYGNPEPSTPTAFPSPIPSPTLPLPQPNQLGQPAIYNSLQMIVDKAELSGTYTTRYNTRRDPPAGRQFLWIHIVLENKAEKATRLPNQDHFSVLYARVELKTTYGHRLDYPDYTDLDPNLFPDQPASGWLRFDVPDSAQLSELQAVYIPNNNRLPSYNPDAPASWADQPFFLWFLQ